MTTRSDAAIFVEQLSGASFHRSLLPSILVECKRCIGDNHAQVLSQMIGLAGLRHDQGATGKPEDVFAILAEGPNLTFLRGVYEEDFIPGLRQAAPASERMKYYYDGPHNLLEAKSLTKVISIIISWYEISYSGHSYT